MIATCITGDLVASKAHPDRSAAQAELDGVLARVNEFHRDRLLVPLSITLGDEWQGLTRELADAFQIDARVRRELHPLKVRSGVGQGAVTTPVQKTTGRMDGPCFHRSREAIFLAKKERGSATVILTGAPPVDDFLNSLERLLHAISDGWTHKQFASVMAFLDHGTETQAARSLGVTQPTLHKSLAGALGKEYLALLHARDPFLRALPLTKGSESA